MAEKEIYILLTFTGTVLSRIIRAYTGEPYSHVSLAFDRELVEIYSFGRKKVYNPLNTGFINEDIKKGVFAACRNTTYALYSFKITSEQYHKLREEIHKFDRVRENTKFNLLGLVGVMFGYPVIRENAYFCSQFVASVFEKAGIKVFDKCPGLVSPRDFRTSRYLKLIETGKLSNYKMKQEDYNKTVAI